MSYLIESYYGHFKVTLTRYLTYRVELVIWLISMILQPVVFMAVWSNAASYSGGTLSGYTTGDISGVLHSLDVGKSCDHGLGDVGMGCAGAARRAFVSAAEAEPRIPSGPGREHHIQARHLPFHAGDGDCLDRRYSPACHDEPPGDAGHRSVPAAVLLPALHRRLAVCHGCFLYHPGGCVECLLFFPPAAVLRAVAPMPFLPAPLQTMANFLPFRWTVDFPARLLIGKLPDEEIVHGLLMQMFWCVIVWSACVLVWRRGVRSYTAVGI